MGSLFRPAGYYGAATGLEVLTRRDFAVYSNTRTFLGWWSDATMAQRSTTRVTYQLVCGKHHEMPLALKVFFSVESWLNHFLFLLNRFLLFFRGSSPWKTNGQWWTDYMYLQILRTRPRCLSVFLPVSPSALQTTQPPKVLFPPERQDTVIEITPGKGPSAAPFFFPPSQLKVAILQVLILTMSPLRSGAKCLFWRHRRNS